MNIKMAVSRACSFSELMTIAEHAEARFSFWGTRYVCSTGYEGTLSIDAFAARTLELVKQFNYEFSLTEHASGRRLAKKIDVLYDKNDEQVSQAACFSRILHVLRVLPCAIFYYLIYGDRGIGWQWRGQHHSNTIFEYYTRAQFQDAFGMSPEEATRRRLVKSSCEGSVGGPPARWSVEEHLFPYRERLITHSF